MVAKVSLFLADVVKGIYLARPSLGCTTIRQGVEERRIRKTPLGEKEQKTFSNTRCRLCQT